MNLLLIFRFLRRIVYNLCKVTQSPPKNQKKLIVLDSNYLTQNMAVYY